MKPATTTTSRTTAIVPHIAAGEISLSKSHSPFHSRLVVEAAGNHRKAGDAVGAPDAADDEPALRAIGELYRHHKASPVHGGQRGRADFYLPGRDQLLEADPIAASSRDV